MLSGESFDVKTNTYNFVGNIIVLNNCLTCRHLKKLYKMHIMPQVIQIPNSFIDVICHGKVTQL